VEVIDFIDVIFILDFFSVFGVWLFKITDCP